MKKLTIKSARLIAVTLSLIMVIGLALFCFLHPTAVTIVSGESYAPIYKGSEKEPKVALMFNVYENTQVVNGILDTLNNYNVKATFFVGGCWADDNTDTVKRILSEGHSLGNHGFFHINHKKATEAQNLSEIKNTHTLIYHMTGHTMTLFAPPSGAFSKTTLKVAEKLGYKTIMWSKDTIDWRDSDLSLIVKRATAIENGDFILMHPKPHTLKALPQILDYYKEKGITPVTVDNLIL